MDPEEYEDDLGIFCVPIDETVADDGGRSMRIGQQRGDYNISPPTIPRTNSADIFSGSAFASAAGQIQSFSASTRLQPIPQHHVAGQIPPYNQEFQDRGGLSSHPENVPSNLRWQSRIIPQAQYQGSGLGSSRHFFTPLHSNNSNEESKFSSVNNPISPVGVTSPGPVNFASPGLVDFRSSGLAEFTSPIHQRLERHNEQTATPNFLSSPPATAAAFASAQALRPTSVSTILSSASHDSLDSESRGRQRRKRRTTTQRKVKTPGSQETPRRERNKPESKSPPPQNLRGDPFRSAKVKTELCRHHNTPQGCPFGDKCNYAHGEHELKYTKLMDLERAGLVDVEIFRTHPCPTWVATGACPFDQRCIGLHDTRVGGESSTPAWLPHAETLINRVASGKNVDKFYHERLASIYNSSPIYGYIPQHNNSRVSPSSSEAYSWEHFYNFVCNLHSKPFDVPFDAKKHTIQSLSEELKLDIVLKFRQQKASQAYAYIPTHLFCGELCMILLERNFRIMSVMNTEIGLYSETLEEVAEDNNTSTSNAAPPFKAYEMAFGPVGDPTVRSPSVWFDIPIDDLTPCTPQQAKHHKRSRHRIKKISNRLTPNQSDSQIGEKFKSIKIPPFFSYQPLDHVAFDLITKILVHRLNAVKLATGKFDNSLHQVGTTLDSERRDLKHSFLCLRRSWVISSWPEEVLHGQIHDETDVPPVTGKYTCIIAPSRFSRGGEQYGLSSKRHLYNLPLNSLLLPSILWKSFTINMLIMKGRDIENIRQETLTQYDDFFSNHLRRLSILRHLSMGGKVCQNRYLPQIKTSRGVGPSSLSQCLEELLGEWEDLKVHYEESSTTNTPLRRSSSTPGPTPQSSQHQLGRVESRAIEKHVNSSAKKWNRLPFWFRD